MRTKISNLPMELLEEILSRVPVKSIVTVRSTCKNWNVLTKNQRFANKHIEKAPASQREKEVLVITGDSNYNLLNVKFYDFHKKTFDPSTKRNGILITQQNSDRVFVKRVFYCNGLLLCLWGNVQLRLLVWNPYWGKTRWIESPTKRFYEVFAFGYDKSCGTHKILRLSNDNDLYIHMDIYDWNSHSWKTRDAAFDRNLRVLYKARHGFSLMGNTYWHVESGGFLYGFDFKQERFGPHLPLPFDFDYGCSMSLSSVKEDKLAVLLVTWGISEIPVWVTNKIQPDYVSWSKFFTIAMVKISRGFLFGSFLIDEEKKTLVVFDDSNTPYNTYIIDEESGHVREVEKIEFSRSKLYNIVSNYVPSSVQI